MCTSKLISIVEREVEKNISAKQQIIPKPAEIKLSYSHTDSENHACFVNLLLTNAYLTFNEGIGFPLGTAFETLERLGFKQTASGKHLNKEDILYSFAIPEEKATQILTN